MAVYVPNPDFEEELEKEEGVQQELIKNALITKQNAEAISPVETGAYREAFEVIEFEGAVTLTNKDFKAHWVEWGSINNVPKAPLRRGALLAGLRFRSARKKK